MEDSLGKKLEDAERPGILLEVLYGLKNVDRKCFCFLVRADQRVRVDDIAEELGKDRSTVYRAVQRLCDADFATKEQVNYDDGGYYHVYSLNGIDEVVEKIDGRIEKVSQEMNDLLDEFRDSYSDR